MLGQRAGWPEAGLARGQGWLAGHREGQKGQGKGQGILLLYMGREG